MALAQIVAQQEINIWILNTIKQHGMKLSAKTKNLTKW